MLSALLLLTLIDENMVLYIKIADRNLLWYIAVFSAALALSRSLIPEPEDAVFDAEGAMRLVSHQLCFLFSSSVSVPPIMPLCLRVYVCVSL